MNIFALDNDPALAARYLCDQHLGKMLLESAQLLCGPHANAPYKRTHYKHPCAVWVRECDENYNWLLNHGEALAAEYAKRFGKKHASAAMIVWCCTRLADLSLPVVKEHAPFAQAMPDRYRNADPVTAYRAYYAAEKLTLRGKPVSWTGGDRVRPPWLPAL